MKFKNLCALFLLSLASVYFICPVQCTAIQEASENTASDKVSSHHHQSMDSQTVDETNPSPCCQSESQPTPTDENRGDEQGHCCFAQWESLGTSEPQLALQIQQDTFSFVVLMPTTPKISPDSVSSTARLQLTYSPYTNPSTSQPSPRAPPFFLA